MNVTSGVVPEALKVKRDEIPQADALNEAHEIVLQACINVPPNELPSIEDADNSKDCQTNQEWDCFPQDQVVKCVELILCQ